MDNPTAISLPLNRKLNIKKETKIKTLKTSGKYHVNHVGNVVPAMQIGNDCK